MVTGKTIKQGHQPWSLLMGRPNHTQKWRRSTQQSHATKHKRCRQHTRQQASTTHTCVVPFPGHPNTHKGCRQAEGLVATGRNHNCFMPPSAGWSQQKQAHMQPDMIQVPLSAVAALRVHHKPAGCCCPMSQLHTADRCTHDVYRLSGGRIPGRGRSSRHKPQARSRDMYAAQDQQPAKWPLV